MVLRRDVIEGRLKELDQVLTELNRYWNVACEQFRADLSQRWIIERGLIAAASIIFDVADHILAGHYGLYPETYEDSLETLSERKVLAEALYLQIKGLGGSATS